MNRWFAAAFVAVVALGVAFRAPQLALRPLHNDEGVNTFKFRDLVVSHNYKYDPNEYHGPTLIYLTLPSQWLGGAHDFNDCSEAVFRAVPAAFGVGLILLLWPLAGDFGRRETLCAALFTAISPAMTYYSRDYIHEMLLTFFTALTFVAAWRCVQTRRAAWACVGGLALGLMAATKETFVFSLVAMGFALVCARAKLSANASHVWKHAGLALALAAVVAFLFYTSFFTNPRGAVDAFRAYAPWLHRAGGATPHQHPWYFYFERLFLFHWRDKWVWNEGAIGLLAVIGFIAAQAPFARVLGWYTIILTLIYTALPYKTPWCLLTFYHGMILLAGIGAVAVVDFFHSRAVKIIMLALLLAAAGHLACRAWAVNFADEKGVLVCADPSNPYVYAQTSPDLLRLVGTVEGVARVSPQKYDTTIEVMSPDSYWPLPWYLRRFRQVGYWDKIPAGGLAPIVVSAVSLNARFDERPAKTHLMAGYFQIRPGVFLELYVSVDLWARYVQSHPAE